jgi:hypothetical protein
MSLRRRCGLDPQGDRTKSESLAGELIALGEEAPTFWHLIWKHNAATRELVGQRPRVPHEYAIDLDRCQTAAQCLDWLLHIRGKTWGTWLVIGALVEAMSAVLDLQRMVK